MKKLSPKDKTIHDQFSKYGKNAKEWMNKCVLLLPQIEKNRIWEKKGFPNIYVYAAKIAGMSRNKVNEGLRILRKAENLPAITEIIKNKGVLAVKPVVSIATKETDEFWAKKASEMSKNTLETFVRDFRKEQNQQIARNYPQEMADRPGTGSPTNNGLNKPNLFQGNFSEKDSKIQISMKLDPEIVDQLKKIKMDSDWNEVIKKLLRYSQKALQAEQKYMEKEEKPESVKTNSHTVNTAIANYIKKRSGGKCEHPNCNKPGRHIHHIEPFALKRGHDSDKLIYLCEEHHQIIHLGYIDDGRIVTERNIAHKVERSSENQTINPWHQIQKLPNYDIKNVINKRISEFKRKYMERQMPTRFFHSSVLAKTSKSEE